MNIVKLHQLIDQWAAEERLASEGQQGERTVPEVQPPAGPTGEINISPQPASAPASNEPKKPFFNDKNQRVVRTKTSGDRVFLLDENTKKRSWLTTPEIVTAHGFDMATDVSEIDDSELMKYAMGPAIYKLPDAPTA